MKGFMILICALLVFSSGFYAMKEFSSFLLKNRKGRKNYEYYYTDDEED